MNYKLVYFTKNMLSHETIKSELLTKGYCLVPNILTSEEIDNSLDMFRQWQETIPNHDRIHNTCDPHGIYKFHQVGHQRHAWYIRTNGKVQEVFKNLWDTEELIVSFDGSCYIPKSLDKKDNIWTHTDQASNSSELKCYQGLVSLTDNKERTLVVYEGSHLLHQSYFAERNIKDSKNWNKIEPTYLNTIRDSKRILNIPKGTLVLWDSRTFHQNQYGLGNSEERIVQYVCYFPRNHPKNTTKMNEKRKKYFTEKRTTSHWPAPVSVNSLQPRTFGNPNLQIDYGLLTEPDLNDMMADIEKLL